MFTNQDLKRLILPLIVEQILAVSVGMVDTMMVSNAGEAATSGVSLVDMVNTLFINITSELRTIRRPWYNCRGEGTGPASRPTS